MDKIMPIYEHRCGYCGAHKDAFIKLADLDLEPVKCPRCNQPMARMLSAPAIFGDFKPYECPITGKVIDGRRAHEENLARHGCRVLEPGETAATAQRRRADDEQLEAKIGETVEQVIHEMPTRKREQLISEAQAGADVQIQRITPTSI